MRFISLPIASLSFLLLAGCDFEGVLDAQRYTADFRHSYPLQPGGSLSLENFNGSVEISGWNDNSIEITGTKHASREDLFAALKVEIVNTPDSINIRTVRPASESGGRMGARYTIRVPRETQLERVVTSNGSIRLDDLEGDARLKTSNGSVRAENLRGQLEASTSNGGVELTRVDGYAIVKTSNGRIRAENVRGGLDASTTNGSIVADLGTAVADRAVRLSTSNGSVDVTFRNSIRSDVRATTTNGAITVRMSPGAGARLRARTSRSTVSTELDVKSDTPPGENHLDGTIGAGGPLLELSTSNGAIRLAKL